MTQLTDVPETMLWTLHNRASESLRPDGCIKDIMAERIYQSIDYHYEKSFGKAEPSHAVRSNIFDHYLAEFMQVHPTGVVINLGEGLETQRFRFKGNKLQWFSVDLAEAIAQRERFIQPDEQHQHLRYSALDTEWIQQIPKNRPVFITAQGLFMYFSPQQVRSLLCELSLAFPGGYLLFDTIPEWLSNKTVSASGWRKTENYTTPPMPWGVNFDDLEQLLERWLDDDSIVEAIRWPAFPRGAGRWLMPLAQKLPLLRNIVPALALIQFEK